MGNSGSSLTRKTTTTTESLHSGDPGPIGHLGSPPVTANDDLSPSRDENFNQEKGVTDSGHSQLSQDVDSIDGLTVKRTSSQRQSSSATQRRPQSPLVVTMTPVTLPVRQDSEPSVTSPSPSTGIAFPPGYRGVFPSSHMSIPPFPSYLPVGPGGQSYSAMLASMGSQFQLAQEQGGHHLLQHPYIPGGYITLPGPLPGPGASMAPVLVPAAASLHHEVPRGSFSKPSVGHIPSPGPRPHTSAVISGERHPRHAPYELMHGQADCHHMSPPDHSISSSHMTSVHQSETFTVGRTYAPTPRESLMPPALRRSTDLSQPHGAAHGLSHTQIPSLEAVLGKTTYPHASGPGGIKIELPPPTIGIHIGTRPTNLGHPNLPLPPPLVHKSNLFVEPGRETSRVVPSSLGAPMTCIGEPYGGGLTTPYIEQLISRHSHTMSHSQLDRRDTGPHGGSIPPQAHIKGPLTYPSSSSNRGSEHDRGNSNPSVKPWPTNSPHVNIKAEPFQQQVKQEPGTVTTVADVEPRGHSAGQGSDPKDRRKSVQSSRPILTSQAPPPVANVPSYFTKGSIIQLANGQLRRVEELQTQDFVASAGLTDGLKVDSSTVSKIEEDSERNVANISFLVGEHKAQVTVEARLDHPFFVYGQGWTSVSPQFSLKCYALNCHTLAVGDVCISLTVMEKASPEPGRPPPPPPTIHDSARGVHSKQLLNSPERKRQRFHDARMAHFEESVERGAAVAQARTSGKSKSLEHHQSVSSNPVEPPSQAEGVVIDQNRNIVAGPSPKTPAQRDVAQERWNQPPKRRWSDPIKSSQQASEGREKSIPNAPHPTLLAKLTEES